MHLGIHQKYQLCNAMTGFLSQDMVQAHSTEARDILLLLLNVQ